MFSESSNFYPHNFGFDGNCRWQAVADQELAGKEVTFCKCFCVFREKIISKTKISRFWPESPGFLEKKIKVSRFCTLSEVGRSVIQN